MQRIDVIMLFLQINRFTLPIYVKMSIQNFFIVIIVRHISKQVRLEQVQTSFVHISSLIFEQQKQLLLVSAVTLYATSSAHSLRLVNVENEENELPKKSEF